MQHLDGDLGRRIPLGRGWATNLEYLQWVFLQPQPVLARSAPGSLQLARSRAARRRRTRPAQVAANNAAVARNNAQYAEEAGTASAAATSLRGAAQMGKIKTGQAASGVNVNTDSAADVKTSQREVNQLNTQTELHNAELNTYGYRTQATSFEAQSELETAEARQAPIGADLAAASGILGNAAALGLKWLPPAAPSAAPSAKTGVGGSKLDERGRRVFAAGELRAAGWGGLEALTAITGLARSTIGRGLKDPFH
jgi:hypothetical protein